MKGLSRSLVAIAVSLTLGNLLANYFLWLWDTQVAPESWLTLADSDAQIRTCEAKNRVTLDRSAALRNSAYLHVLGGLMALCTCETLDKVYDPNLPNCGSITMMWPKRIMVEEPYSYVNVRSVAIAKMETYVEICF